MKKDTNILLLPTLLLAGAFIGSQIDDYFEPKTTQTTNTAPQTEWPFIKILLYGAGVLFVLNQAKNFLASPQNG